MFVLGAQREVLGVKSWRFRSQVLVANPWAQPGRLPDFGEVVGAFSLRLEKPPEPVMVL